jgi:hypothetical protein
MATAKYGSQVRRANNACSVRYLEAGGGELCEQGAEGFAAVGELPLLVAGDFGEGEVEGGEEEEGVVAEAVVASGGGEELAFGVAFGAEEDFAVSGEGEVADEAGGAVGFVLHEVEEEGVVAVVLGGWKYRGLSTAPALRSR